MGKAFLAVYEREAEQRSKNLTGRTVRVPPSAADPGMPAGLDPQQPFAPSGSNAGSCPKAVLQSVSTNCAGPPKCRQ